MTQFLAFSKKELLETWRTKKLVLLFNQLKHYKLIDDVEVAKKGIK